MTQVGLFFSTGSGEPILLRSLVPPSGEPTKLLPASSLYKLRSYSHTYTGLALEPHARRMHIFVEMFTLSLIYGFTGI
jgi:hypothetical protein